MLAIASWVSSICHILVHACFLQRPSTYATPATTWVTCHVASPWLTSQHLQLPHDRCWRESPGCISEIKAFLHGVASPRWNRDAYSSLNTSTFAWQYWAINPAVGKHIMERIRLWESIHQLFQLMSTYYALPASCQVSLSISQRLAMHVWL